MKERHRDRDRKKERKNLPCGTTAVENSFFSDLKVFKAFSDSMMEWSFGNPNLKKNH